MFFAASLCICSSFISAQEAAQGAVTPTRLVDMARTLVPEYDGEHRAFLTPDERRNVTAATQLLAGAQTLGPDDTNVLWWLGHANTLLAEDSKSRGDREAARERFGAAYEGLRQATALDPEHLWSWYARGLAAGGLGQPFAAIDDLDRCIAILNHKIELRPEGTAPGSDDFMRFKARKWRAEMLMRSLQFAEARQAFRSFYADNGNNRWDLGFGLGEAFLRERNFAGARRNYEEVLGLENYDEYSAPFEQLGYIAGLTSEWERSSEMLRAALEREIEPGLYLRLWIWVLCPERERADARSELEEFLENPPSSLSAWDGRLGRMLMGEGTIHEFKTAARAERERRLGVAQPLDDVVCEALFYSGLRLMREGDTRHALRHFHDALRARPATFKWEWEYARFYGAVCVEAEAPAVVQGGAPKVPAGGVLRLVHRVGDSEPRDANEPESSEGGRKWGDLLQFVVEAEGGPKSVRLEVSGVR